MKKIIIESHIPFVTDQFDGIAEVVRLAPEDITPAAVADADAMIVRTRTRCDACCLKARRSVLLPPQLSVRIISTLTTAVERGYVWSQRPAAMRLPWLNMYGHLC